MVTPTHFYRSAMAFKATSVISSRAHIARIPFRAYAHQNDPKVDLNKKMADLEKRIDVLEDFNSNLMFVSVLILFYSWAFKD